MPTDIRRIRVAADVTDLIFLEDWEYIGENDAAFIITFSKRINGREYLLYAYCANKEQLEEYSQLACDVTQYRKRLQQRTEEWILSCIPKADVS